MIIHLAIVALGLLVFLVLAGRQWLFSDDWAFVAERQGLLFAPHVGHWSTVPYLVFLGIRNVFGIDHYLPFAVPVIVVHLLVAHLTWVVMRRIGVLPWIATAFSVLTVFFGVGSENILWAFQLGFVGAMAAMLAVIVILLRDQLGVRALVSIAALSTVAVATSGTALPLLFVAILIALTRHGLKRTLLALAPPVVIYAGWFLLVGRTAAPAGRAVGGQILLVPKYALSMLSDGLGLVFPIPILGVLLFVVLVVWWLYGIRSADRVSRPAFLLFLAAPVFALLTGYSRIGLGLNYATGSRYLYFAIFAMLPFIALGLSRVLGRFRLAILPAVVLVVVVGLCNAGTLAVQLHQREAAARETRTHLSAAADLVAASPTSYSPEQQPYTKWALDVQVSDLEDFVRFGWFHPVAYSAAVKWDEVAALDLRSSASSAPVTGTHCQSVAPGSIASLPVDAGITIRTSTSASVEIALGANGEFVPVSVSSGWNDIALDRAFAGTPDARVKAGDSTLQLCAP